MEMLGMRKNKWTKMKQRLEKGEIHPQTFVDAMKNARLYYSTPFGDGRDGSPTCIFYPAINQRTNTFLPFFIRNTACSSSLPLAAMDLSFLKET